MLPKNGWQGISMESENLPIIRCLSSGMILVRPWAKSSRGSTPRCGEKPLERRVLEIDLLNAHFEGLSGSGAFNKD